MENEKTRKVKAVLIIALLATIVALFIIFSTGMVSANRLYCLSDGQQLPPGCVSSECKYTCSSTLCQICTTNSGFPGVNPATCNGQTCSFLGGGGSNDLNPPSINLVSPKEGDLFTEKSIPLIINLNEQGSLFYMDLLDHRPRWSRICSGCSSYSNDKRFNEGENSIKIKAVDNSGNENYTEVSFFIDSKKPKIKNTFPRDNEFANGEFIVEFQEENAKNLTLYYGNSFRTKKLNINNDCVFDGKRKYICSTNVDLNDFDQQQIEYYFVLSDIAGGVDESKHVFVNVDNTAPVLKNPGNFWTQDSEKPKYIYFNLSVDEINFNEVVYTYLDSRGSLKEKRLCSKLVDGICEKRKTFRQGNYDLNILIRDAAGNSVGYPISFDVA